MTKTAPELIAEHVQSDWLDVKDGRYQHYHPTVYVYCDDYYTCPPKGKKPADMERFQWVKVCERNGRPIYFSKC